MLGGIMRVKRHPFELVPDGRSIDALIFCEQLERIHIILSEYLVLCSTPCSAKQSFCPLFTLIQRKILSKAVSRGGFRGKQTHRALIAKGLCKSTKVLKCLKNFGNGHKVKSLLWFLVYTSIAYIYIYIYIFYFRRPTRLVREVRSFSPSKIMD